MSCSFHIFTTVHRAQRAWLSEVSTKAILRGGQLPSSAPSVVNGESRCPAQVPCVVAAGWTFSLSAKPSSDKTGPGEHCPQPRAWGGSTESHTRLLTGLGQSDPHNLATLGIKWAQCPGTRKQSVCPLQHYLLYHPKSKQLPQLSCKKKSRWGTALSHHPWPSFLGLGHSWVNKWFSYINKVWIKVYSVLKLHVLCLNLLFGTERHGTSSPALASSLARHFNGRKECWASLSGTSGTPASHAGSFAEKCAEEPSPCQNVNFCFY